MSTKSKEGRQVKPAPPPQMQEYTLTGTREEMMLVRLFATAYACDYETTRAVYANQSNVDAAKRLVRELDLLLA